MPSPHLPPGFRFHPTDEELITHYLKKKVFSPTSPLVLIIADIDLYKFNPWELPTKALFGDDEWFFFTPRDRKYPKGARPNRSAGCGYWKATGTDKPILNSSGLHCLGVKKGLVFYKGRPQKGEKTDWVMQEYRLLDDTRPVPRLRGSMRLDDYVLCRIRQKSNIPHQIAENQEYVTEIKNTINYFYEDCRGHEIQAHREALDQEGLSLYKQENGFQTRASKPRVSYSHSHEYSDAHELVSPIKYALESLKRSVPNRSNFDEQATLPPNKRLHSSVTSDNMNDISIFQIPYLAKLASSVPQGLIV